MCPDVDKSKQDAEINQAVRHTNKQQSSCDDANKLVITNSSNSIKDDNKADAAWNNDSSPCVQSEYNE
jgi:hypothetical protein